MEQSATSVIHEIFGMSDGMKVMTIGASTDASNVIPFCIDLGHDHDQTQKARDVIARLHLVPTT